MEINVHPVPEIFYLATDKGWKRQVGHLITVGKYEFSVVPSDYFLIVSEVKTGAKVFEYAIPDIIETHRDTMMFIETFIGEILRKHLQQIEPEQLDALIERKYKKAIEMCGEKPNELSKNGFKVRQCSY